MSKIDYKLKSDVLKTDYCLIQKKVSKSLYYGSIALTCHSSLNNPISLERGFDLRTAYDMRSAYAEANPLYWNEACKINHAQYQRTKRLRSRVEMLLEKPCVFLTLTFNDKSLENYSPEQRRKRVAMYLKTFGVPYVANIDFGKEKGREHYHAIVQVDSMDCSYWIDRFGAVKTKKIIESNSVALSKYISKLTNHAIKETTRRQALIYSK